MRSMSESRGDPEIWPFGIYSACAADTGTTGAERRSLPWSRSVCPVQISKPQMTDPPSGRADAATAGMLLVGAMITCAAAGYGLGTLVGLAVPIGLLGLFAGLAVGFALVYARYRRL